MSIVDDPVQPPVEDEPRSRVLRRRQVIARIAVGTVCALLVAMWIYAFGFASKKAAYRVDDDAWRERADQICERWEQERLKLVDMSEGYIENPTQEQMLQRADLVERATDIIETELEEVTSVRPPSVRDQELVETYRGFVETLISDRRDYIAELRRFELQPYEESAIDGGPVSNVIIDFTTVNEMDSCAPPGELGGDA